MAQAQVKVSQDAVFLNIPYDEGFKPLYLAYIVGLIHLNFEPRVTLGISGGTRRLDKIFREIQGCRFSVHDLSKVQSDRNRPSTPRFNMPFELGLAVAWSQLNPSKHTWFAFEQMPYRIQKSLSDLNGTDPHIHDGKVQGVMRGLCNAFIQPRQQTSVPEMMRTYRIVCSRLEKILQNAGTDSPFEATAFQRICYVTKALAEQSSQS